MNNYLWTILDDQSGDINKINKLYNDLLNKMQQELNYHMYGLWPKQGRARSIKEDFKPTFASMNTVLTAITV